MPPATTQMNTRFRMKIVAIQPTSRLRAWARSGDSQYHDPMARPNQIARQGQRNPPHPRTGTRRVSWAAVARRRRERSRSALRGSNRGGAHGRNSGRSVMSPTLPVRSRACRRDPAGDRSTPVSVSRRLWNVSMDEARPRRVSAIRHLQGRAPTPRRPGPRRNKSAAGRAPARTAPRRSARRRSPCASGAFDLAPLEQPVDEALVLVRAHRPCGEEALPCVWCTAILCAPTRTSPGHLQFEIRHRRRSHAMSSRGRKISGRRRFEQFIRPGESSRRTAESGRRRNAPLRSSSSAQEIS